MITYTYRDIKKYNLRRLFAVIGLLVLTGTTAAREIPTVPAERVGMSTERLARITQMNQRYVDSGKMVGILTAVVRDGKLVHQSAVGTKGMNDPLPLAMDDLFRIYSMTKPITAVAIMQLYEQGKFHLSDPVAKFIPEFENMNVVKDGKVVPAEHEMTMHHLLTHTAGFSYGSVHNADGTFTYSDPADQMFNEANLWQAKDLDEFAERLAKVPLKYEPGTQWHYSIGVDVTGLVVQRISGQSFDEYLAEHIFSLLDMHDTFFAVPADKVHRFLPVHYRDMETGERHLIPPEGSKDVGYSIFDTCFAMCDFTNVTLFLGGGGLVSTLRDFVRFAEALRAGGVLDGIRILSPKTVNYMTMNHLPAVIRGGFNGEPEKYPLLRRHPGVGYGLGFAMILDLPANYALGSVGQYYWAGAAGTVFWIDPVEDIVIVSMMQLLNPWFSYRRDVRNATYQAITESKE